MNARNVRITDEGLICGTLPLPYPPDLNTIFPVWRFAPHSVCVCACVRACVRA
jgi:hypothetical protein